VAAPKSPARTPALESLIERLELDPLDRDLYLGDPGPGEGRLFGGMVAAQSVVAAYRTVESGDRPLHSLHAYFLRPGRHDLPIRFVVDRIRDGKSFTTRRVVAHQGGEAIFNMSASFARPELGVSHQDPMPEAPDPEGLQDWEVFRATALGLAEPVRDSAVEVRLCDGYDFSDPDRTYEPRQRNWIRIKGELPDDPVVHAAVLVYVTDRTLLSTAARAHGLPWGGKRMSASLDHTVWIHRPFARDGVMLDQNWMLYATESPAAFAARGIIFGGVFTEDGVRIASVAQEALVRLPTR
jgi:acyl-CoA thioesterase-2